MRGMSEEQEEEFEKKKKEYLNEVMEKPDMYREREMFKKLFVLEKHLNDLNDYTEWVVSMQRANGRRFGNIDEDLKEVKKAIRFITPP